MRRISFVTFGCKVNQYESQALREAVAKRGYTVVGDDEPCDLHVINTCTVTENAAKEAERLVRRRRSRTPFCVYVHRTKRRDSCRRGRPGLYRTVRAPGTPQYTRTRTRRIRPRGSAHMPRLVPPLKKILSFIAKHNRFLCSGHIRSDGDALGSQLALNAVLKTLGKKSHVVCDRGVSPDLVWLPGASEVGADPSALRPPYDAVITCDSGSWQRLERISAALDRRSLTVINIDHHASNDRFGDLNWIDPRYSSTGEMIWDLTKAARVKPNRAIATCVYTAIVTDTGSFRFSNTTEATHARAAECIARGVHPADVTKMVYRQKSLGHWKLASLLLRDMKRSDDGRVTWMCITPALIQEAGSEPTETQDYLDIMKSIKGVEVAILLRAQDGKVKVSWRTDAGIDGITLASRWGGGGHPRASGASIPGTLSEVERLVVDQTLDLVRAPRKKEPARERSSM